MRYLLQTLLSLAVLVGLSAYLQERPAVESSDPAGAWSRSPAGAASSSALARSPGLGAIAEDPAAAVAREVTEPSSVRRIAGNGISYGREITEILDGFWRSDARRILGFGSERVRLMRLRDEERFRSAHYRWESGGLPVTNSKVSLFFDSGGVLIQAVVDVPGERARRIPSAIGAAEARSMAQAAFARWISAHGGSPDRISALDGAEEALVSGADGLRPVFYFRQRLPQPLWGEIEIVVDGVARSVASIRNISRR